MPVACAEVLQEALGTDSSVPTSKLQRLRGFLSVVAYRMWKFRATAASRSFLKYVPVA